MQSVTPKRPLPLALLPELLLALWWKVVSPFRTFWRRSWLYRRTLKGKMPDRILFHPYDAIPKQLQTADQLLRGRFAFAGEAVDAMGGSIFEKPAPNADWSRALHGFDWLPPLSAAGGEPARALATNLITQWIRRNARYSEPAWCADVISRRLLHLFAHGRFVMANSDVLWRSRLLVSLREQSRQLSRTVDDAPEGLPRLQAAVSHVLSGACLNDSAKRLESGLADLEKQIACQILPDGGHVSRSPEALLHAFRLLVMVIDALTATEYAVPASVRGAHDRMAPMLRFFRHGDGALALFNGGGESSARMVESLLARGDADGAPFQHAPHSGYQRLAAAHSLVLMDCGRVPEGAFSLNAHAGCLAFELSSGGQRIVVNCGTEGAESSAWKGALRATAAHSTVTLADTSMANVLGGAFVQNLLGPRLLGGPLTVECNREELPEGSRVIARHDGYARTFAVGHERTVCLSPRGNILTGLDRLEPMGERRTRAAIPFAVRFHIHPDIRLSPSQGGGFILKLPNGEGWRFRCSGDAEIEESVYVANGSVRKAEQFVVSGRVKDNPAEIGWTFERMG